VLPDVLDEVFHDLPECKPEAADEGSPTDCTDDVEHKKPLPRYAGDTQSDRSRNAQSVEKAQGKDQRQVVARKELIHSLHPLRLRWKTPEQRRPMAQADPEEKLVSERASG